MTEWERNAYRASLVALKGDGYEFEITADRFFVKLNGKGLGGAGVHLPREKPLHWRHRDANLKENLKGAVNFALRHKETNSECRTNSRSY